MMLDDIEVSNEDDDRQSLESAAKIPWYLIDTEK